MLGGEMMHLADRPRRTQALPPGRRRRRRPTRHRRSRRGRRIPQEPHQQDRPRPPPGTERRSAESCHARRRPTARHAGVHDADRRRALSPQSFRRRRARNDTNHRLSLGGAHGGGWVGCRGGIGFRGGGSEPDRAGRFRRRDRWPRRRRAGRSPGRQASDASARWRVRSGWGFPRRSLGRVSVRVRSRRCGNASRRPRR